MIRSVCRKGLTLGVLLFTFLPGTFSAAEADRRQSLFTYQRENAESEWDEEHRPIITARSQLTEIAGEGWDDLKEVLEKRNDAIYDRVLEEYQENLESARERHSDIPEMTFSIVSEDEVTRADDRILSIGRTDYRFLGGAHGLSILTGSTYDSETGQELLLPDLTEDETALTEALMGKLALQAEEAAFFDEWRDTAALMIQNAYGREAEGDVRVDFTVDRSGVNFIFDPYDLAPYSSGMISVRLSFAEFPDLFIDWIETEETDRFEKISLWEGNGFLPEEKYGDGISLETIQNTKEATAVTTVKAGEKSIQIDSEYGPLKAWYLQTSRGDFLYMDFLWDNDYRNLRVLRLDGEELTLSEEVPLSLQNSSIFNVEDFILSERIYVLGTYTGLIRCHMDENGLPVREGVDQIAMPWGSRMDLTLKADLTAKSPEGTEVFLPAGTRLKPEATDGESFMDLSTAEGSLVRLSLASARESKGWGFTVNGIDEQDLFEFLPYAG